MRKELTYDVPINEEKVKETIVASKASFLSGEAEQMVSPGEFLFLQSRMIQKRWWFLQGLLLAFVCGVLGTGSFIQGTPVGIGEDFLEDLLRLQCRLGSFEVTEPAVKPAETQISGTEKCQNKQEVNGVENHAANTRTLFLLFGLYRLFRSGYRLLGCCLFVSGSRCGILQRTI